MAPARTSDRAKALTGAAVLASNQADYSTARGLSLESLDIKREIGDRQGIASFETEEGREAHLNGPIAAALMASADELLATPSKIFKIGIIAEMTGD